MKVITYVPSISDQTALKALWKEAFGDSEEFINMFYGTAFSPDRVFCVGEEEGEFLRLCGGLYWFDGSFTDANGKVNQVAYIYAVAVSKEKRGLGYGKKLMEAVHTYLKGRGYHGILLAPAEEGLFEFYEKLGYTTCTYRDELHLETTTNVETLEMNRITKEAYAHLRSTLLPPSGVRQEKENLDYLEQMASFYAGENYLLAATIEDEENGSKLLRGIELLTEPKANTLEVARQILEQSGCPKGIFRTPGTAQKVTMYYPLQEQAEHPTYLGFIFD